jgi:hypothetical protein
MRVRNNLGIIGSTQSISLSSAGFLASSPDIYQAKLDDSWPIAFSDNANYTSLISAFSGVRIYVSTSGNDLNSGLFSRSPLKTIEAARTLRDTYTAQNVMILVYPGTYTPTPVVTGFSSFVLNDYNASFSTVWVCAPGKVIIQWTRGGGRDTAVVDFSCINSAVYGAIFKRNNDGEGTNYSLAFCNTQTAAQLGSIYNCVYQETNANANWSLVYNNSNTVVGPVNNCTFAVTEAAVASYSIGSNQVFNNCVYNWTYTSTGATQNSPQILANNNLNFTTYAAPGVTTAGVYSGTYAWTTP